MKVKKIDWFLLFPLSLFSFLFLPFLGVIPHLDGNIEFVQTHDFYIGGLSQYFEHWSSVHPPLKLIINNAAFHLFGFNPLAYELVGYLAGIIGILAIYGLAKTICDNTSAKISSLLFASSPLFIANGIFNLRDYLLTIFVIIAFYFYAKGKLLAYGIIASLAVLTKETGIIIAVAVLLVEGGLLIWKAFYRTIKIGQNLFAVLPFIISIFWLSLLRLSDKKPWSDWIFADTADKGSLYTVFHNFVTFNFFNNYAKQQWLQLFVLNFNWVYWVIIILALTVFLFKKNTFAFRYIIQDEKRIKTHLALIFFFFLFSFSVLTFQTYTIPRYALPIIPILLLWCAVSVVSIFNRWLWTKKIILSLLCLTVFISLFFSIDPWSIRIWGKSTIFNDNFYSLHEHLDGNDGITYNMQYLFLLKKRSQELNLAEQNKTTVKSEDCHWVFPDPNNDSKTLEYLNLKDIYPNLSCTSSY